MSDERRAALLEKVARAMWLADLEPYDPADRIPFDEAPEVARAYCLVEATAALTVALEEAAKVAESHGWMADVEWWLKATKKEVSAKAAQEAAAAAIRALIPGSGK